MRSSILKFSARSTAILTFILMVLPGAKNNGCGPSVPIGSDTLGEVCGSPSAVVCGAGEFCAIESGCDGEGICTLTPEVCTEEYAPVCGCDNVTYSNACHANGAGTNVAQVGECGGGGGQCGGLLGLTCPSGEFCDLPFGTCGIADETGTCTPIPQACDASYAPVCGCDGSTYSNACVAASASISVESSGECAGSAGAVCGGLQGLPCDPNLFCLLPVITCGAADETGICTLAPDGCTEEFMPVCGCDNVEYSNACNAHANSMSIAIEGPCPQP